MTRRFDLATGIAMVLAALVGCMTLVGVSFGLRPLLAAAFLLWVPGSAAIGFLRLADRLLSLVLSIACSIALGTLGAELMLWSHTWHPRAAVVVLALASCIALACQTPNALRHTAPRTVERTEEP